MEKFGSQKAAVEVLKVLRGAGMTDEQAQPVLIAIVNYAESRCRLSFMQGYREGMALSEYCKKIGVNLNNFDPEGIQ